MKKRTSHLFIYVPGMLSCCFLFGFANSKEKPSLSSSPSPPERSITESSWEDITTQMTAGSGHENHRGSAWCDYDNDGLLDLYTTHFGVHNGSNVYFGSPNQLLKNIGNGEFIEVTTDISGVGSDLSHHSAWADIDNDGLPDLFVGQSTNFGQDQNHLLHQDVPGIFSDITNGNPLAMYWLSPRGVSWQDVNLDGYIDLYVTNSGGDSRKKRLMINQGDNTFVLQENSGLEAPWLEGRGCAWTDFDNDGLADVYVVAGAEDNSNEVYRRNMLYKNNGDGTWTNVANSAGVGDVGHGRGCAWGDINNDGWMDLIVGNQVGSDHPGNNKLFTNNGDGTFTDISESSGISSNQRTRCVSMADYDNDGFLDLYVVTFGTSTPLNQLFHNNGDNTFTDVAPGTAMTAPNNGNSASWADFDNDGWIDIFAVGGSPTAPGVGHNRLIRNTNHNGNHWVEFELCGTVTNRSAIGARVQITYIDDEGQLVNQMRDVQSGNGYNSQHMFRAHFGLGSSEVIDQLTIHWPSGIVQLGTNIESDRIIRIVESTQYAEDCNRNCIDDYYDITHGTSTDFDNNGIPDECDCNPVVDCNENCIEDALDIQNGTSTDDDDNGIPDECDCIPIEDCNENCIEDSIDIQNGTSLDLDGNGIPDECNCPVVLDCNGNCIEDSVDIQVGYSYDLDGNGVPDECECAADFDNSGDVDIQDLLILLEHWEETNSEIDLTGDGIVDIDDLLVYIASFGPCE
jgi:hypothetical protein